MEGQEESEWGAWWRGGRAWQEGTGVGVQEGQSGRAGGTVLIRGSLCSLGVGDKARSRAFAGHGWPVSESYLILS